MLGVVRDGEWSWGLGDPSGLAIAVTLLYFIAAAVCWAAFRKVQQCRPIESLPPGRTAGAGFWQALTILLLGLGVNKQADLQSLLTLYGRDILRALGLYEQRREIQLVFIVGVTLIAGGTMVVAFWQARRWSWQFRLAALGLALQAAFVVIRAASFHHFDRLLGWRLGNLKFNLILESTGLLLILFAASAAFQADRGEP